ncbi:disulfide bond formation protein B [Novosphingobium album (ex Liu et al. 2023)]|uniref:Disulfide bond formation protein B n=1 Tax=Novosphingobium album (ex Liu et al. 2023) TaxID=3031130 RepID=A0ABT5WP52_9SPHN|nr:disulfide bond formation protein B [Novosphingobium album (ex Liu et al. 2023)]MDE8651818.1 disulfide bond formation protein B [Novosphingobium album (ex Liu et al. 2023)]
MGDFEAGRAARLLALVVPAALLAGAYTSQYGFGLYPCEMCWWQRYPHFAAVALALIAFLIPPGRVFVALAGVAIAISGAIGLFHAGVEYGWWEGVTACTANALDHGGDPLQAIMDAPVIRCDVAPWSLFGVSLAGWNFLFSGAGALAIFLLLARGRKGAA